MVGVPPSASVAVAEQVRVSSLYAELGEIETLPITGSVLLIRALPDPESLSPLVSVAVAVQVNVSPGSSLVDTV